MPHARKSFEVRRAILTTVRSFQKPTGIEGKGACKPSSAALSAHRSSRVIEDIYPHAEPTALDLAAMNRPRLGSPAQAREDVVPPEIDAEQKSDFTER